MEFIRGLFVNLRVKDIIDILIVATAFYKLFQLIRETRAEQLTKGILALFVFTKVSEWLQLYTVFWILEKTMTVGILALIIVFQPELRRALEYIGRSNFFTKSFMEVKDESLSQLVEEIVEAVASLSRQKIGALIVIERATGLSEIVETGTRIDGIVSSDLLINIFIPNTPLHDGAVIIKEDMIKAAGCFLPLTENTSLSKDLGTRHRAALGVSEKSDSLSIIVSEETGAISIAENGSLARYLDTKTLRQILMDMYKPKDQKPTFLQDGGVKMSKENKNDLTLKIFALIIAIILWSYVMSEVNPPFENEFKNIDVRYVNERALERQGLVIMEPQNASVRVTISGRRSEVLKVSSKDIIAQVDLSGYSEGEQKVPVYVQVPDDVKLVDYSPKEILFKFDKIISKSSPVVVETQGNLPQGYVLGSPIIKPQSIYIEGPRSWVNQVDKAVAFVDITGKTEDIHTTESIKIVDDQGNPVRGVSVEQNVVDISIPVYRVKKVPVELQTENQLPDNYEIVDININPSTIEIKGKQEDLAGVNVIKTKPIDINTLIDNRNVPVELDLPEGVSLVNPDLKVTITLNIDEIKSRTFNYTLADVDIVNLDSALRLDENDLNKSITLILEGSGTKIDLMDKEDIKLKLDLQGFEQGSHRVDVEVLVEEGIEIIRIIPESLDITLIQD